MNKLIIPAALGAVVLVAGMFAFIPVQKASTVHNTIASNILAARVMQETFDLSSFPGNGNILVLMDTTNVGDVAQGHFAAVLPNSDAECDAGDDPAAGISVLVGVAGVELVDIAPGTNTGISASNDDSLCVFHVDFFASDTAGNRITDVAFVNDSGDSLPDGSSITVSAQLEA